MCDTVGSASGNVYAFKGVCLCSSTGEFQEEEGLGL